MKNKKTIAIISLTASILSLIPLFLNPESLNILMIFICIGILFAVIGCVFGFIAKNEVKTLSIIGIVIGIISLILQCFTLIGFSAIKNVVDCVDNGNGTAKCLYMGQSFEVPIDYLTDEQMKKEGE